jgi:hypothetical protein
MSETMLKEKRLHEAACCVPAAREGKRGRALAAHVDVFLKPEAFIDMLFRLQPAAETNNKGRSCFKKLKIEVAQTVEGFFNNQLLWKGRRCVALLVECSHMKNGVVTTTNDKGQDGVIDDQMRAMMPDGETPLPGGYHVVEAAHLKQFRLKIGINGTGSTEVVSQSDLSFLDKDDPPSRSHEGKPPTPRGCGEVRYNSEPLCPWPNAEDVVVASSAGASRAADSSGDTDRVSTHRRGAGGAARTMPMLNVDYDTDAGGPAG